MDDRGPAETLAGTADLLFCLVGEGAREPGREDADDPGSEKCMMIDKGASSRGSGGGEAVRHAQRGLAGGERVYIPITTRLIVREQVTFRCITNVTCVQLFSCKASR